MIPFVIAHSKGIAQGVFQRPSTPTARRSHPEKPDSGLSSGTGKKQEPMANQNPSPATRFARGKSGNPGGRPRGESLTARLRRYLDGRDKDGRHRAERLAQKIAELALSGGIQAIRLVLDRMEGKGAILKCGYAALVLDCCYVDICVIFSSSGSLRMRLISQFSRASEARFSETDDSPETVVGRWILPAKLKALLGSSTLLSQVVPGKYLMAESKSPLFEPRRSAVLISGLATGPPAGVGGRLGPFLAARTPGTVQ